MLGDCMWTPSFFFIVCLSLLPLWLLILPFIGSLFLFPFPPHTPHPSSPPPSHFLFPILLSFMYHHLWPVICHICCFLSIFYPSLIWVTVFNRVPMIHVLMQRVCSVSVFPECLTLSYIIVSCLLRCFSGWPFVRLIMQLWSTSLFFLHHFSLIM